MSGYRLEGSVMQRELYRLLCAFMALEPVRNLHAGNKNDPLQALQARFAEGEVVHLLISTATTNRLHMEHMGEWRNDMLEFSFPQQDGKCGQLQKDTTEDAYEELSLREACNKIIHANTIEIFDWHRPVLRLSGQLRKATWEAMVEIVDYVRLSQANFQDALA